MDITHIHNELFQSLDTPTATPATVLGTQDQKNTPQNQKPTLKKKENFYAYLGKEKKAPAVKPGRISEPGKIAEVRVEEKKYDYEKTLAMLAKLRSSISKTQTTITSNLNTIKDAKESLANTYSKLDKHEKRAKKVFRDAMARMKKIFGKTMQS